MTSSEEFGMPTRSSEPRRKECRDANCPVIRGDYRCKEHDSRGDSLTELTIRVNMDSFIRKILIGAAVAVIGSLGGIYWTMSAGQAEMIDRLSAVNDKVTAVSTKQTVIYDEFARFRQRLEALERERHDRDHNGR